VNFLYDRLSMMEQKAKAAYIAEKILLIVWLPTSGCISFASGSNTYWSDLR
jgi:hypothetical protein